MIEYVEIRSAADREIIGIIDGAISIIWHSVFYGVGDFEIYAPATQTNLALLQEGNYITRPDDIETGIIEQIQTTINAQDGLCIIATGRFAKSILNRRHIYKISGKVNTPTILRGNVEQEIRTTVYNNAINCTFDSGRNIPILELGAAAGIPAIIVDENGNAAQKQVSYENLLEYTDGVLQEYSLGATVILNDETKKFQYYVYAGVDRSADNTAGNEPVIFSAEFDNLSASEYTFTKEYLKNVAIIGGEGEGLDRFYSVFKKSSAAGLDRRETFIDASSVSKKYDDNGTEREYTDAEYKTMINAAGKQALAEYVIIENFSGTINVNGGIWRLNEHYMLGDVVTVQDNTINKYTNVRITEITEAQDADGYTVELTYEN